MREIDEEKIGDSSKNDRKDVLSNYCMGSGKEINAINSNKFSVNKGKKESGIKSFSQNQNHDIINCLVKNGVNYSPKDIYTLSIGKLIVKLSKCDSFAIIIKHKNLLIDCLDGIYPSEFTELAFEIGKGEICAIMFRYIILHFYGYLSVYDEVDYYKQYEL